MFPLQVEREKNLFFLSGKSDLLLFPAFRAFSRICFQGVCLGMTRAIRLYLKRLEYVIICGIIECSKVLHRFGVPFLCITMAVEFFARGLSTRILMVVSRTSYLATHAVSQSLAIPELLRRRSKLKIFFVNFVMAIKFISKLL